MVSGELLKPAMKVEVNKEAPYVWKKVKLKGGANGKKRVKNISFKK